MTASTTTDVLVAVRVDPALTAIYSVHREDGRYVVTVGTGLAASGLPVALRAIVTAETAGRS